MINFSHQGRIDIFCLIRLRLAIPLKHLFEPSPPVSAGPATSYLLQLFSSVEKLSEAFHTTCPLPCRVTGEVSSANPLNTGWISRTAAWVTVPCRSYPDLSKHHLPNKAAATLFSSHLRARWIESETQSSPHCNFAVPLAVVLFNTVELIHSLHCFTGLSVKEISNITPSLLSKVKQNREF